MSSRLAVSSVSMSIWSWGRKATILVLRNFEQEVDILGIPGTAAKHERQPANERVADRSGVERLGHRLDGLDGIARQEVGVNVHGVR